MTDGNVPTDEGDACANVDRGKYASRPAFCLSCNDDAMTAIFCGSEEPRITGMADLLDRMPKAPDEPEHEGRYAISHSTAVGGRLVSAINPRVIRTYGTPVSVALAFTRGEQRVELAARDLVTERFNLYLLEFEQACNDAEVGCTPGDLFTSAIEADWLRYTIRGDEELKNTPMDCRRCHGGSGSDPGAMLLMRELSSWTHWFDVGDNIQHVRELNEDFRLSRGTHIDPIAGVWIAWTQEERDANASYAEMRVLMPSGLEYKLRSEPPQPLVLLSAGVRFGDGRTQYEAFRDGDVPEAPYPAHRVADPVKLEDMSSKYRAFLDGDLPLAEFPDLSGVFPDDSQVRAEIGLAVEMGATGPELLLQACLPCHNDGGYMEHPTQGTAPRLDQNISRANFDARRFAGAQAGDVSDEDIEDAIARLMLPPGATDRMPPAGARVLDDDGRERLVGYLRGLLSGSASNP